MEMILDFIITILMYIYSFDYKLIKFFFIFIISQNLKLYDLYYKEFSGRQ